MNTLDNARSRDRGPTLLMCLRAGLPEHTPEAEPVLVQTGGGQVTLTLDDGEQITLDASELRAAIEEQQALGRAA